MAFVDEGEFEAMKTPIGRTAPRCDKDQFRYQSDGEYLNRLRDIIVEKLKAERRRKKNTKNGTSMTAHFRV